MRIAVTEQIYLSPFRPSDLPACLEHFKEKEIYDQTLRLPYPYTEADFQTWMEIVQKTTEQQGRVIQWAIRDETDFLIGGCGFHDLEVGKSHRAEIGYWLAKPYWGRGILSAVVPVLCHLGYTDLGLVKITAHVFAGNRASARVLEKSGFTQEGYLRKHYLKEGQYIDSLLFGRLKED